MAITPTNGYCTGDELKAALSGISDTDDDAALERAINVASRLIDQHCGQRFWQDGGDTTREYHTSNSRLLTLHGQPEDTTVTSVTTLTIDRNGDGTFGTTWTEGTDFRLGPANAGDNSRPYRQIIPLPGRTLPTASLSQVRITGTFGWAAIPVEVTEACLMQASETFKTVSEAPFGVAQVGFDGSISTSGSRFLRRDVQLLLRPFVLASTWIV